MDKPVLIIAAPYDDATVKAIRDGFSKQLGRELDFEIVEDNKIIGGFIAIIDGKVYDASFSSRLYEISRQLTE
ncbi:ATP synthase delta (OSCP) subunit [Sporobacter termitidis DSM 10068]|uniref:ATP synthase delta (OSCP) subunit n=1 Tax=Sporobacter termitidis DSM 10068 TaxID=1123282 RepID=A0A1M5VTC1_9FIRM|nr:F0F1 ATP synthase subunit delta [Sporobacter termitidis]SHH78502.1 ATP synthase delta (OSCP) subunit [Sporobacter termitidis DSM 10068]